MNTITDNSKHATKHEISIETGRLGKNYKNSRNRKAKKKKKKKKPRRVKMYTWLQSFLKSKILNCTKAAAINAERVKKGMGGGGRDADRGKNKTPE